MSYGDRTCRVAIGHVVRLSDNVLTRLWPNDNVLCVLCGLCVLSGVGCQRQESSTQGKGEDEYRQHTKWLFCVRCNFYGDANDASGGGAGPADELTAGASFKKRAQGASIPGGFLI